MSSALHRLIATLLIFFEPLNPKDVGTKYYRHLSEDFQYITENNNEAWILHQTVTVVKKCLEGMEKSLVDFNLSKLLTEANCVIDWTKDVRDALVAPILKNLLLAQTKLNARQKLAYKEIMHHIKHKKPGAFFTDGPGGTMKTFLYCALYALSLIHI